MKSFTQSRSGRTGSTLANVLGGALAFAVFATMAASFGPTAFAQEVVSSEAGRIARGGRLYDNWFSEIRATKPSDTHALWPASNERTGDVTWRCKSCHGWDYLGKDGAYATGSYQTGIIGIGRLEGADTTEIVAILKSDAHALADLMDDRDFEDLALFVSKGQFDMDSYIDRATAAPIGDLAKGQGYYETVCARCHGAEGTRINGMDPLGDLMSNPWEIMHKIRFGQPVELMPALFAFDPQVAADIMVYAATLPKEK